IDGAGGGGGRGGIAAIGGGGGDGEREALRLAVAGQRQAGEIGRVDRPGGDAVGISRNDAAVIEAGAFGHAGSCDGNDRVGIGLRQGGGDVERDCGVLVAGRGAGMLIAGAAAVEVEMPCPARRGADLIDGAGGGGGRGGIAAIGGGGG